MNKRDDLKAMDNGQSNRLADCWQEGEDSLENCCLEYRGVVPSR